MENQQHLQMFWNYHRQEIEQTTNFNHNELPLARIKKIMKSDDKDGMLISKEASIFFAKACELFILELTTRFWLHTNAWGNRRNTVQKNNVVAVINRIKILDFLLGKTVPREEGMDGGGGGGGGDANVPAAAMPYYNPTIAMMQSLYARPGMEQGLQSYLRTPSAPPPPQQQLTAAAGIDPTLMYVQHKAMSKQALEEGATYGGGQGLEGQGYVGAMTATQPPQQQQEQPTLAGDTDPTLIYLQEPAPELEPMYQQAFEEGATYGGGQGLEGQGCVGTTTATQPPPQQQQQQPTLGSDIDPTSLEEGLRNPEVPAAQKKPKKKHE